MRIKLTDHDPGHGPHLLCPKCNSDYLRHERVVVFERGEDDETGLRVIVSERRAAIDNSLTGNPSSRRDGITIYFSCESCHTNSKLEIAQHKGQTEVRHIVEEGAGGATAKMKSSEGKRFPSRPSPPPWVK
jgi:hypothetical protein